MLFVSTINNNAILTLSVYHLRKLEIEYETTIDKDLIPIKKEEKIKITTLDASETLMEARSYNNLLLLTTSLRSKILVVTIKVCMTNNIQIP